MEKNETYKKLYDDLLEEHCELLRRLPKPFVQPKTYRYCPYCGNHGIHIECNDAEFHVRGVHVKCFELVARCLGCGEEIYIPTINDWNVDSREWAYQRAKMEAQNASK
jgi:uncharacterized protein with PIN domain